MVSERSFQNTFIATAPSHRILIVLFLWELIYMNTSELLKHIYEMNLSYLLLAQRLIHHEKDLAMFRLGINDVTADFLLKLTLPQIIKLAETSQFIFNLRFSDSNIEHLLKDSRIDDLQKVHASILLSGHLLNELSSKESRITKIKE